MIKNSYIQLSFTLLTILMCSIAKAQTPEDSIKATINLFFDGMRETDSTKIRASLAPNAILQTIAAPRNGKIRIPTENLDSFIVNISRPHTEIYDERIQFETIRIDGRLASVWTPYQFYVGSKFSHCGVNSFQLVRFETGWKIQYIIDTRRRDGCGEEKK